MKVAAKDVLKMQAGPAWCQPGVAWVGWVRARTARFLFQTEGEVKCQQQRVLPWE